MQYMGVWGKPALGPTLLFILCLYVSSRVDRLNQTQLETSSHIVEHVLTEMIFCSVTTSQRSFEFKSCS